MRFRRSHGIGVFVTASEDSLDAEALNDRLAREHPIDDYYRCAPLPIRVIEHRRLAIIRAMIGESSGLDLCEIGVGGGHVLRMFPQARLTAVDVSGAFLDIARRNLAGYDVRFIKGDAANLRLPPASFDRIICTEVLEHTADPEAVLAAIAQLLRPTGIAVVTVPNDALILKMKSLLRRTPAAWMLGKRVNWGGDVYHLHRWTPAQFEALLVHDFAVTRRRAAPVSALPLRMCFRCVPR
jgi:SAM-dependent methyltransferase